MPSLSRRGLLIAAGKIIGSGLGAGLLGSAYSTLIEPHWIEIRSVRVNITGLSPALAGFKIVQFSDTHFGPYFNAEDGRHVARIINDLEPDLVVFTGDLVTRLTSDEATQATRMFSDFRSPKEIFAVLGNHDHWTNPTAVAEIYKAAGVTLLQNEPRSVSRGEGRFWLAGIDDVWESKQDLRAALEGVTTDDPIILLAHEPDYADVVAADGRVALQLSGHSHGGQVRLPGIGAPVLPYLGQKYPEGLRSIGDMFLYTNRGVGVLAPPVRLNCRPEITEILLAEPTHTP